jgi:hypothetical protein
LRERYRNTIPSLDAERTRIMTDYYRTSQHEVQIIRRATALYKVLANMTKATAKSWEAGTPGDVKH